MPRGTALVVRFSSLGDVLLAAHLPSFLRQADPGRRVLFATKERYAPILRGHPDVARFYLLADGSADPAAPGAFGVTGSLGDLAAFLKREEVAETIDLQQSLRSSRLAGALPRSRRILPPKHALRRRLMVYAKWLRPKPVPPRLEAYREVAGLPSGAPARPWLRAALSAEECARGRARMGNGGAPFALLGVGARWATKRWPAERFAALGTALERALGLEARYAVEPGDEAEGAALRAALPGGGGDRVLALGFREIAACAAHARLVVANDSAVLHLGPALGVPAVGIFGSTVPAFGFAPPPEYGAVAEIALGCRPCGVHGRRRCPLGHHRCMRDLSVETALEAARRALA